MNSARRSGFTLIELMVVMLLISIIMAVAIPRFEGGLVQDPTKKLSRWLISTVKTLRSTAIQKQLQQSLVIDSDSNRMWIVGEHMDEAALSAAAENAFVLPAKMRIVDIAFPNDEHTASETVYINFYPAGFSDSVVVRLENNRDERFSFLVEPLLPKVKFFEEWISF